MKVKTTVAWEVLLDDRSKTKRVLIKCVQEGKRPLYYVGEKQLVSAAGVPPDRGNS